MCMCYIIGNGTDKVAQHGWPFIREMMMMTKRRATTQIWARGNQRVGKPILLFPVFPHNHIQKSPGTCVHWFKPMQQESSNNPSESSSAPVTTPSIVPLSPCCTPTSSQSGSTRWSETLNPDSQPPSSSTEDWVTFSSPTNDNCYLSARPEHIRAHGFDVPGAVQSIVTPSMFSTSWEKKNMWLYWCLCERN